MRPPSAKRSLLIPPSERSILLVSIALPLPDKVQNLIEESLGRIDVRWSQVGRSMRKVLEASLYGARRKSTRHRHEGCQPPSCSQRYHLRRSLSPGSNLHGVRSPLESARFKSRFTANPVCYSSDSLLVHEDIADEFTKVLAEQMKSKKASGSSPETPTSMRGVFNQTHADKVTSLVNDAVKKGAKVVIGSASTEKSVVQPVVLEGTNPQMDIYSQEIFGPAMTLNRFKTTEEAIEWANSSEYGLAASIYGSNEAECWAIAKEIESGQVHINGSTVHDAQTVPHGGLKKSGYGRFNGLEGLREFSTTKTITINFPHGQYPV